MRFLIFGFQPYGGMDFNISKKVVERVRSVGVIKEIFPVVYDKKMFTNTVKKAEPDAIIGLGMHPRGRMLRIERKAKNLKRDGPIGQGPDTIRMSLSLPKEGAWLSYDAGRSVCNFSMYVIRSFTPSLPFAFIHVPKTFDAAKAADFVEKAIRACAARGLSPP